MIDLDKKEKLNPFFNWGLNCAVLAIYPALPLVDKDSNNTFLLLIGLGAWSLKVFYAATSDSNTFKTANFIVFIIGALNYLWIIHDLNEKRGLNEFKQFIAWIVLSMELRYIAHYVYNEYFILETFLIKFQYFHSYYQR